MRSIFLFLVGALAGCGTPDVCPSTFAQVHTDVIQYCATSNSCHSTKGHKGDLDLQAGVNGDLQTAYAALVNAATSCVDPCKTAKSDFPVRVVPSDTAHSFLWKKLTIATVHDASYGDRMPQSNPSLDDASLKEVRCWIEAGAKM